jgi:hypothetical protein
LLATVLMSPIFLFLKNVWIRTQRAAVVSVRATNLATHIPDYIYTSLGIVLVSTPQSIVVYSHHLKREVKKITLTSL